MCVCVCVCVCETKKTEEDGRGEMSKRGCTNEGSDGIEALVLQVPISEMGKIGSNQLFNLKGGKK